MNYLGLVKKFVVDTNEIAREKALDAVLAYVENIPAASKYQLSNQLFSLNSIFLLKNRWRSDAWPHK